MSENNSNNQEQKQVSFYQTPTFRGGLIGACLTAFISWNTGRYNRIGLFLRRWKFIRTLICPKPHHSSIVINNYHRPNLDSIANNFYCYSGQPGIGKSFHFNQLVINESQHRPSIYVSFKAIGRQVNLDNDVSQQLNYGEQGVGMLGEIIRALKKIKYINQNPFKFQLKLLMGNLSYFGIFYCLYVNGWGILAKSICSILFGWGYFYYLWLIGPLFIQSIRRTNSVVVFDDLNKIQHLNMLPEIVRFLNVIQSKSSNIILVSSDEQTWSRLRKQPGMKDRLRVRQIKYDHIQTANRMVKSIDQNYKIFMQQFSANVLLQKNIIKALVKDLIGIRQMCLRRFMSVLKLVDEEQYESLVEVLKNKKNLQSFQVAGEFREILLDTETDTMVSNLKIIKRQLVNMTQQQFISNLQLLIKKYKLPADNKVAAILKMYNIVRDLRSEYVINGKFTLLIFQLAVRKYKQDLDQYQRIGQKSTQ